MHLRGQQRTYFQMINICCKCQIKFAFLKVKNRKGGQNVEWHFFEIIKKSLNQNNGGSLRENNCFLKCN